MIALSIRRTLVSAVLVCAALGPASAAWTGDAIGRFEPAAAHAQPVQGKSLVRMAQGGCSAAASQAAAQTGGQVLSVQTAQRGGRTVCIVTVLIPGRDGDRPRRQTITIPQ